MQKWERPRRHVATTSTSTRHQSNGSPSFSATLLDTIYRSMEEDAFGGPSGGPRMERSRPVTAEAAAMRSATVVDQRVAPNRHGEWSSATLASTTSRSSLGAGSSSSYDLAALPTPPPLRPIRTGFPPRRTPKQSTPEGRMKTTGGSTRFQASEFYGEVQKTRPPVSPGARLASFLTSLFMGKPRKAKSPAAANSAVAGRSSESSRSLSSCFVKTPSSCRGAAKRSVRLSPPGDLVGEEPTLVAAVSVGKPPSSAADGRKRAGVAARELSSNREKMGIWEEDEEDDEDDGGRSCSSSDLFELENLSAIDGGGGEKGYLGELPVNGTTHLETNRVIISGLLVL